MGFLSDLGAGFKALTATPGVMEALDRRQFSPYISLGSSPNARRASERISSAHVAVQNGSYGWIYSYTPSVRSVIDFVADNAAQLGLKVYKRISDDEREHVGDHPAAEALRWPNPWTPGPQFIRDLFVDFLIYDNAYAVKFPSDAGLTMVNVPAHLIGLVGRSYYQVEAYRIWDQDGGYVDFPPERILHWRGKNPSDPRRGESKLETAREELSTDAAIRASLTELARSGLSLPGWVERSMDAPEWSDEGQARFIESFTAAAKSSARRIPVLEDGMVFKTGGVTPEDAELILSRRYSAEQIAGLYGLSKVPPENEDQRKQFYADVLPPLLEMLASYLDLHVLIREYGAEDHYCEFNLDEKLIGDDRLKALTSAAGAPPLTRNEARARLNLPAKPGGDELITPLNVTVGGKPSPQVMPIQDPNKPSQEGDHREDGPEQASLVRNGSGPKPLSPASKQLLVPRRRRASDRRDRWAGEYQGVIERHFARQRQSLKSKRAKNSAITEDRWNTELGDGLNDVAERQFEAEGKHVAFRLASDFDPDYGVNWLAAKALGAAEAINLITRRHAEEVGLTDAFGKAEVRAAGAAMAYATDIAAFSTKVACEQAPGEPTVTIDGGECEVCAPFQGSWAMSELEQWPAYHANCECVADVTSAPEKAIQGEVRAIEPEQKAINVNVAPPDVHVYNNVQIPEGAVQVKAGDTHVEAPPPAEVYVSPSNVNVSPAEVTIEEGAVSAPIVNVQAPEPQQAPDVYIDNPVNVQPAEVKLDKGAIEVNVSSPEVTVEAPQAPNVNVEVKGGGAQKRKVTFDDGRTAERDGNKVTFSDGRKAEIAEADEEAE